MPTFQQIYLDILDHALTRQAATGAMPAGQNGHYRDPETPVRNTSHYLIAFLRAWELTEDSRYGDAAIKCLDWLVVDNPHRSTHTFHHRTKAGKDQCNGLIGPAWNIEALLYAAERLQRDDARALARQLFLMHPFDETSCIWNRVEPNGDVLPIDATFNHQLWFAACAAPLAIHTPEASTRIRAFLNGLDQCWKLAANGRVIHPLWLPQRRFRERAKRLLKPAYRRRAVAKEVGYQAFNLHAFALLKLAHIPLPETSQRRVQRALNYLHHPEYTEGIQSAQCGYPYNPPGWEVTVSMHILETASARTCKAWIESQLHHSYDPGTKMLSRNTSDAENHTARIYEAARLPDSIFRLPIDS